MGHAFTKSTLWLVLSLACARAADLTTTAVQAGGTDWNAAIWQVNGSGTAMSPAAGNTYQTIFNGTFIGNTSSNTRIRNPATAGLQTFRGDSLTLNDNTELRAKGAGAILNFPGVGGQAGLILNGGMLNAGDDTTFAVTGLVQVASQSYISQGAAGGGGGISPARAFNFTGPLTGTGDLVILNAGTSVPQQVSSLSNTFSGQWVVQCGWLLGAGDGSLGTGSILVDPLYMDELMVMPAFEASSGDAWFEPSYEINSPASLALTNGGMMKLHQNCTFSSVLIEGESLSAGTHYWPELAARFPTNFVAGGAGSITVQPYGSAPSFPPTVKQPTTPAASSAFNGGTARFAAAFIGTAPLAYQWRFTTNRLEYIDLPGATNRILVLTNLQATNSGYYSLWASNALNGAYTVGSGDAQLQVIGPAPALKPFPLSANQRGTVACLQNPSITYDIYLPPAYATNGTPLPLLYTLWASGGGMVTAFQNICSNLNIIVVGITGSKNKLPLDPVLREFYADTLDIRQRVLFDPKAEFVAGESGGGENSYIFSRFRSQHVAGLLEMAGWLGRINSGPDSVTYYSTDRVQTNLLVARTTGLSDTAALFYNPFDSNYLAACGAIVQDWFFNGGHGIAPDNLKLACLNWLVSQRTPAGLSDPSNALAQAASWRTRTAAGQSEAVFRECVTTLMNQPRTWFALEAQLVMDDLMTNYNSFRWLNVSNLVPATDSFITNDFSSNTNTWSQSDLASDLFYYAARGAGNNNDRQRYYACLKALTGIANVNGDRYGDLYSLLTTNGGYPAPVLRASAVPASGQICVRLQKDTPSLSYTLQTRARLANDVWQSAFPSTIVDTDTIWSGQFDLDAGATNGFYRVGTVPTPLGDSPPWPPL